MIGGDHLPQQQFDWARHPGSIGEAEAQGRDGRRGSLWGFDFNTWWKLGEQFAELLLSLVLELELGSKQLERKDGWEVWEREGSRVADMWEPCAMELGTQRPALGEVTTCIQLTEAPEAAGHMHGSRIRSHLGLSCGICWENSETQRSSSVLLTVRTPPPRALTFSVSFHTLLPSCFLECWVFIQPAFYLKRLPCGPNGKEAACSEGGLGLSPGLGRSPGERNGYRLHYSCLENSMDVGVCGPQSMQRAGHDWSDLTGTLFKNFQRCGTAQSGISLLRVFRCSGVGSLREEGFLSRVSPGSSPQLQPEHLPLLAASIALPSEIAFMENLPVDFNEKEKRERGEREEEKKEGKKEGRKKLVNSLEVQILILQL